MGSRTSRLAREQAGAALTCAQEPSERIAELEARQTERGLILTGRKHWTANIRWPGKRRLLCMGALKKAGENIPYFFVAHLIIVMPQCTKRIRRPLPRRINSLSACIVRYPPASNRLGDYPSMVSPGNMCRPHPGRPYRLT